MFHWIVQLLRALSVFLVKLSEVWQYIKTAKSGTVEDRNLYIIIIIITIINPLIARVVGAPQMIFATSFLHFPLFSTAPWDLPNSRPVHSLMLSSHLYTEPKNCRSASCKLFSLQWCVNSYSYRVFRKILVGKGKWNYLYIPWSLLVRPWFPIMIRKIHRLYVVSPRVAFTNAIWDLHVLSHERVPVCQSPEKIQPVRASQTIFLANELRSGHPHAKFVRCCFPLPSLSIFMILSFVLSYSVLVSVPVFMAFWTQLHSINSPDNSSLSHSVLPVLFLPYVSFQLYISLWKSPSALI